MKMIIAYIRPELLATVKQALLARELTSMSVLDAQGDGFNDGARPAPEQAMSVNDRKVMRVEMCVIPEDVDAVLDAFKEAARSSRDSELTVYIQDAMRSVRIRTEEERLGERREAVA
ncbi:MAG: P-II family nitrogen regulator [Desulfovibrionaceae bacterium]